MRKTISYVPKTKEVKGKVLKIGEKVRKTESEEIRAKVSEDDQVPNHKVTKILV